MNDTIALDFGTMRTKVAYHDTTRNSLELMRLGRDERPYIPSLFFLGEDGRRLFGDDAVEHLDSDPLAFLPKPLKRELREQWVRAGNRVKATPTELLSILFCGLRNRTSEVACFRETAPTGIFLTVPAQYGPPDREVLAKAAHNAGFYEERIRFVDEPVAAAQAWLAELGGTEDFVVVLDCGGGTLDWACLHRSEGGRFELLPELPPGGDNRVGGFDVDEAIYALVDDAITDTSIRNELETRRCLIRDQVRALKERHSRTGDGGRVRVGNVPVEIPGEVIADIVASRFITQACQNLCSYLDKVRERVKIETPTVLLVGGSARLRGFKEAVTEQCRCKTVWWERSEYATVLGAMIPTKGGQKKSTANAAKSIPKPVQPKPEPTDGGAPPPRPKASATSITTPAPSKEDATSALMYCSKCGKQIVDDSRVCPECGAQLGGGASQPPPPTTSAAGTRDQVRQPDIVYPKNPPLSPHLCWVNLLVSGLAQIIHGQVAKGIVMLAVTIASHLVLPFILALVIEAVSVIDAFKVGKALASGKPVRKWDWFPQ